MIHFRVPVNFFVNQLLWLEVKVQDQYFHVLVEVLEIKPEFIKVMCLDDRSILIINKYENILFKKVD